MKTFFGIIGIFAFVIVCVVIGTANFTEKRVTTNGAQNGPARVRVEHRSPVKAVRAVPEPASVKVVYIPRVTERVYVREIRHTREVIYVDRPRPIPSPRQVHYVPSTPQYERTDDNRCGSFTGIVRDRCNQYVRVSGDRCERFRGQVHYYPCLQRNYYGG